MKFCLRMRCQSSRFYHEIHWNSTFLLAPKMKLLFSSFFSAAAQLFSLSLVYVSFSARVSYHFAVCSSLSIAINHFDTHTTDTHSQKFRMCDSSFFLLCSSLLCFSFIRIHTCSPLTHMMRTITCTHTKQRTRKIPRNNRFVWLPLSFFFSFFFLSLSCIPSRSTVWICKIISASELCETRWQTRRLSNNNIQPYFADRQNVSMCACTPKLYMQKNSHSEFELEYDAV